MGKPAARITDFHACPMFTPGTPPIPHVGGPVALGSPDVFTGGRPQARVGDLCICVGPPDIIAMGSTGVFVNGMAAARVGDLTAHGGIIVVGMPTVLIGETMTGDVSSADFTSGDIKATWLAITGAAASFGDAANHISLFSYDAEAESNASYDLKEGAFEVTPISAHVDVSAVDVGLSQSWGGGAATASESVQLGHVGADVDASAGYADGEFHAEAQAGAEAMIAQASAQVSIRITPKTILDNTIGRLTHTSAPESWDKGIEIGAQGQAGYGASARASASAKMDSDGASVSFGAKAGVGLVAGVNLNLGIVW